MKLSVDKLKELSKKPKRIIVEGYEFWHKPLTARIAKECYNEDQMTYSKDLLLSLLCNEDGSQYLVTEDLDDIDHILLNRIADAIVKKSQNPN